MKNKRISNSILYFFLLIASGLLFGNSNALENSRKNFLSGGTAKVNITPEMPVRMSGYANRKEPFSGIHDSLYAVAMVFSDGKNKVAIVTSDLIGLSSTFCSETTDLIEKETGISKENIMLSAAHNHGGPVVSGNNATPDEVMYFSRLQKKIIQAVAEASQNLQPILLGSGKGICNMNINRRARFADGNIWLGRNPDGPCDHDVSVVRIDDIDHNPLAIFVNWPCHGTVSGGDNTYITGDWPGATARVVEKAFDNNIVVPVTAGASGNINPIYGPNERCFRDIDAIGMLLGEEVINISKKINTSSGGSVKMVKKTILAKGKKGLKDRSPNQKLESGDDVEIILTVLKVGDILFAGISGELFTEIGMRIKAESVMKNIIVTTHCNGTSGYLCTDEAYPLGGYEIMVTRTMPGTESLIKENLLGMIKSIK